MFTCIVVSRVHLLYTQELGLLNSQYTPGHLAPRTIYSVYSQTPSTQNNIHCSWDYQILSILLDTQHLEQYTLELGLLDSQYNPGHLAPRTIYSGVGIIRFSVCYWIPSTWNNSELFKKRKLKLSTHFAVNVQFSYLIFGNTIRIKVERLFLWT